MAQIQVLDQITIDKIAAGEVVERPASVVKELAENAIDAKATAITVEIRDGGISFIRISDNGTGIPKEDVPNAFLRHSTSKIRGIDDLNGISSLGFRGEALSSVSAVAQVELLTKTKDAAFGTKYRIHGGKEISIEDAAAPDGTTFLIHQIFYNTPARRKFLKTPMTEASHIGDLMTRLALSHPEISFQFINNDQNKLHTSGNGKLKDVIYHIYGREIANQVLELNVPLPGIHIYGYLGKPEISRGNRNFETYFVNGRYIKSNIVSKAIEDAYKDYTMQHKYPFAVLQLTITGETVDVNVHPTKMELRFSNQQEIYNQIYEAVRSGLREREMIPHVEAPMPKIPTELPAAVNKTPVNTSTRTETKNSYNPPPVKVNTPEVPKVQDLDYFMQKMRDRVSAYHQPAALPAAPAQKPIAESGIRETSTYRQNQDSKKVPQPELKTAQKAKQLDLFEEKLLSQKAVSEHQIVGQVFDTYWLVQYMDNLYIIDQHAAHERVLYEKTLKGMKEKEFTSQMISPPIILSLSMQETETLNTYMDQFTRIGFEFEKFGGDEIAVRAVPDNLYSIAKKELLIEMLDQLTDEVHSNLAVDIIDEKIASMSCKAAVKGNSRLSAQEVHVLITELLKLENPYHCPHGRPTIIAMSKRELEKKFKRIV